MEDGVDAVRGRMSGLKAGCPGRSDVRAVGPDVRARDPWMNTAWRGQIRGKNSEEFVDENWGKDGEKLDLPATHEIRGSNPTKLHHTNKSQKKIGAIFVGQFSD